MRWPEIALRLMLIVSLFGASLAGVTSWLLAPLGIIAIAATTELAVRPYATNPADRLLLGCGAVVTTFILIGLGLNLTAWGLTKITWSAAWLIVSIGVLAWRRDLRTNTRWWPGTGVRPLIGWMVSATLMLIAAIVITLAGIRHWDKQPLLAFSVVSESTHAVVVDIEATSTTGSYQIMAESKARTAHKYSSALFSINAGDDGLHVRERVPINIAGTWTIDLESVNQGRIVRTLIVYLH